MRQGCNINRLPMLLANAIRLTMLEVHTVYEHELKACRATLDRVACSLVFFRIFRIPLQDGTVGTTFFRPLDQALGQFHDLNPVLTSSAL